METITMSVRLSEKDKKQADSLFQKLGLTTNAAINMFIKQCIREQSFPFIPSLEIEEPNERLLKALEESETILKEFRNGTRKGYNSCEELFETIDNEI